MNKSVTYNISHLEIVNTLFYKKKTNCKWFRQIEIKTNKKKGTDSILDKLIVIICKI